MVYDLAVVRMGGYEQHFVDLVAASQLHITPKEYRHERGPREGSMLSGCRLRGPDLRVRPTGRQKTTRALRWLDPRRGPDLAGHDQTRPVICIYFKI